MSHFVSLSNQGGHFIKAPYVTAIYQLPTHIYVILHLKPVDVSACMVGWWQQKMKW